jgi:hypothetical protein
MQMQKVAGDGLRPSALGRYPFQLQRRTSKPTSKCRRLAYPPYSA